MYYDFEGNLIRRVQRIESTPGTFTEGIVQKYYYDHRNRMIKVENFATPNDATATIPRPSYKVEYGYDAFDRRVYKVTTSYTYATNGTIATTRVTVQRLVWLLDHVQMELNQRGEATDRYLNSPMVDQVFANEAAAATVSGVTYAGGLMWLLGDNQNTVRDVVMRSGTDTSSVTIHRTYSAFGRITTETTPTSGAPGTLGTSVNLTTTPNTDIAYTGRDLDRTTGFQYHRARWYAPFLRRWTQKDPWVWGGGDTNLYRYIGNSPTNGHDPSGFEELSNGSFIIVENSTGLLGEWLEAAVEAAGRALKITEGFENKWAEKHEMRETFQTAGPDDVVIYLGERYQKKSEVGVMPANDIPGGDLKYFGLVKQFGTTYSLDEIIGDLKKTPGDPAIIFFAGCQSKVLGDRIIKETNTKIVFGTTVDIGLGDARFITEEFLKHLPSGMSAHDIAEAINRDWQSRDGKVVIYGDKLHKNKPLNSLIAPYCPPQKKRTELPATIFGPYFNSEEGA